MSIQINWNGNANNGRLMVDRPNQIEIRTGEELVRYIRDNHQELESTSLELLGSIALFLSIRDYGRGEPGTILNRAERALDSFYLVLPDKNSNDRIEAGLEDLRFHLFPFRASFYEKLLHEAFGFIISKL